MILCLLIFLCAALPAAAGEIHPKLLGVMESAGKEAEIPVIIRLADQAELAPLRHGRKKERLPRIVRALREKAETSQQPVRDFIRKKGGKKEKSLWIINALAASVSPDTVAELAALPGVKSVQLDEVVPAPAPTPAAAASPEWNLAAVHAPELWSLGYTGQGVVVASMDTGVDINHPDLKDKWRGGTNSWFDPFKNSSIPYDVDGHGTATMSVMVGGNAGGSAIGMAPDAKWIAVKIFPDSRGGYMSAIHQGFQWLLDPDGNPETTDDAPDVVNNSWTIDQAVGQCIDQPNANQDYNYDFHGDIQVLQTAGVAVVFASGNAGPNSYTSESPANYPESFAVGAVDQNLDVAWFSGRGPSACDGTVYPELVAPGASIRTADLTGGTIPHSYAVYEGTSFSSPHVAGAMALLLSAFPGLSVAELEGAVRNGVRDLGSAGADNDYGYGLLDVLASYRLLRNINVAPPSHDFGIVNVGAESPLQTFSVTNQSGSALSLDQATFSGSGSADFGVTEDNCSGATLSSGETCTIAVVYKPLSDGSKNADLLFSAVSPAAYSFSIPLSGSTYTRVTLLAPNGGEVIPAGSRFPVQWGAPARGVNFNLAYSTDNGLTWALINKEGKVTGTSYDWPVPKPIANRRKTLLRVTAFDGKGKMVGRDRSDKPFAVEVVKLASPNGDEALRSGESVPITWTTNGTKREVAAVKLWYTLNGGVTWRPITALSGNPGNYDWKAPPVAAARNRCRVRVVLKDSRGFVIGKDDSDRYFTVQPPTP